MYKPYQQEQMLLLPPCLSDMVPENHLARVINDIVDRINITEIEKTYHVLGQNSYHPRMMIKVLFYGYATGVRSSRKLEKKLREDVVYMWLSGMQQPDHGTLSLFRKERLKEIKSIFVEIHHLRLVQRHRFTGQQQLYHFAGT